MRFGVCLFNFVDSVAYSLSHYFGSWAVRNREKTNLTDTKTCCLSLSSIKQLFARHTKYCRKQTKKCENERGDKAKGTRTRKRTSKQASGKTSTQGKLRKKQMMKKWVFWFKNKPPEKWSRSRNTERTGACYRAQFSSFIFIILFRRERQKARESFACSLHNHHQQGFT